jgi:cysteine synthase A
MPQTQSKEKIELLDLYGADLRLVQATSYSDEKHYVHAAKKLAEELSSKEEHGAIWARQFDNPANKAIHYNTTGAEIWQQTDGKVDGFICSVGTGGTLAGVGAALKERNPNIKIGVADPMGSALYNYYTNGELKSEGRSITEGIGISIITGNLKDAAIDMAYQISDETALPYIYNLLQHEGLCLGGSSAINIAGAVELAKELGPGHTIVTVLCDYGHRYQSKLFNPAFLRRMKLTPPSWLS